ncbi:hypothetical protein Poli38472_014121 [Pythium oligandrum]|uniref:HECT-type E3 ubiquitin transferase n=1 Tax=Pythium oligandrum TaxID=41045 RepID=A0A8K1FN00_PYTOL|nr:hypothetical protein Poli38472_014121 [Pythium oligandrum]|eukprot:TMW66809.1 hypothetical protein Poli38472_014121 [Pythium oligandrum]
MFLRDKELKRGATARNDRSRVLEQAKAEREARAAQKERETAGRRIQFFLSGLWRVRTQRDAERRDFDAKVADITRLMTLLQRSTMPLPYPVLFELLRKLLFAFNGREEDNKRLEKLCGFFRDTLEAMPEGIKDPMQLTTEQQWQLERLVDLCLQAPLLDKPLSVWLDVVEKLCDNRSQLWNHVQSSSLRLFSSRGWQYSAMPPTTLPELVRSVLVSSRALISASSDAIDHSALLVFSLKRVAYSYEQLLSFVHQAFSVPLLPELISGGGLVDFINGAEYWNRLITVTQTSKFELPVSPFPGIASSTWLLGNLLWIADKLGDRTDAIMAKEAQMFTQLLRVVPAETFAPSGVAVSWTKVSESHSVPVVYPNALNNQLRLIVKDRYLRLLCQHLLSFYPSAMRVPLSTERPTPMYPSAPTVAEQFGFGDIASARSSPLSFSGTWQRVKTIGRASWAKRLLEKAGLKKRNTSSRDDDVADALSDALPDTSSHARELAVSGSAPRSRVAHPGRAFNLHHVYSLAQFCSVFLSRWGRSDKHSSHNSLAMKMLNVMSFHQLSADGEGDEERTEVALVRFLWCVLQEERDFESTMKSIDLLRARSSDGYIATLGLFCVAYSHLLLVLDDEEVYGEEFPLPLRQLERVVIGLKHALHAAYWHFGNLSTGDQEPLDFGFFVVDAATRLLGDLYNRCSRLPFCNVTSWVLSGLDSSRLIEEVLASTPRANKLITAMPFVVPFPDRVKLFQRLVQADKAMHQGDGKQPFRVRIRRGAILEDSLMKLTRANLKKKIHVVFVNAAGREEVGIDAGGLFKELWLDLANLAFDLQYGLFLTTPSDQLLYPNPNSASTHFTRESDHLTLFQFVGRILGKALYEEIVVQPKFAHFFLSKLLHSYNHLNELPSLDPEIYKNLMFLKSYEGDVEDLGLTHTVVHEMFGQQHEIELVPNGANVPVTNQNKTRYVHLVANYYLNTQIREHSTAFRAGIADLLDLRWLQMFNEPELQVLISGKSGHIDVSDLRANTRYMGGYYPMDKRVLWFWQALESFTPSERAAFLRFTTSCQRAPSLGFSSLTPAFCIQKIPIRHDDELLPASSTCFNTLKLPTYSSYKALRQKLLLSISSGAGFEMT